MLRLAAAGLAAAAIGGCAAPTRPPAPAPQPAPSARAEQLARAGFRPSQDNAAEWSLAMQNQLLFASGSDDLNAPGLAAIAQLAAVLREVDVGSLRLEGHTDDVGNAEANQRLSVRRAQAVLEAFAQHGMPRSGMRAVGWGSTRPIAEGRSDEARAQNRRVVVIVAAPSADAR